MLNTKDPSSLIKTAQTLLADIDQEDLKKQLAELQAETLQPDFWDKASAQEIMQKIGLLNNQLEQAQQMSQLIEDLTSCHSLLEELDQEDASADQANSTDLNQLKQEAKELTAKLSKLTKEMNFAKNLSGRFDQNSAIISIHSGQGGTEAMDWAEMLARMYTRYFEKKNWKFEFISETRGEEAGIKEATFEVKEAYAYGYLKNERGTHRLVRLSPFNADNLRQTSFALVEVMPVVDQEVEIELKDEDLEWHFTRAGGPGGQSVNKTNSAVELTHKPTNITVKSRQSRTQVDNKKQALKILKAKLASLEEMKLEKKLNQEKGEHQTASWGTQIRNYVLHPYQLVKDTRTKVETSDAEGVLDGDLDRFIFALQSE
jgi:peptide chain release factor 2